MNETENKMRLVLIQLVFGVGLLAGGMFFLDPMRFATVDSNIRIVLLGFGVSLLYFKDGLMLLANSVITLVKEYKKD
jgi:hypothetical protein